MYAYDSDLVFLSMKLDYCPIEAYNKCAQDAVESVLMW